MRDDRPVLVIAQSGDAVTNGVVAELRERWVPVVRLDIADFPSRVSLTARFGAGTGLHGSLRTQVRDAELGNIRSLFHRRPSPFEFPDMSQDERIFAGVQARYGFGGVLASLPRCLYANHPHLMADAEYRPAQFTAAVAIGLDVPATLVTNDPDEVRAFAEQTGPIVYRPLRELGFAADRVRKLRWTAAEDPGGYDGSLRHTTHLFQARVARVADARVILVGERVFAVRREVDEAAGGTDDGSGQLNLVEPPARLVRALQEFLARFGLQVAAFDFALAADGRWWFLGCDPHAELDWADPLLNRSFTLALADLLQRIPDWD